MAAPRFCLFPQALAAGPVSAVPALSLLWGNLSPCVCCVALSQRSTEAIREPQRLGGSPRGPASFPFPPSLGLQVLEWKQQ